MPKSTCMEGNKMCCEPTVSGCYMLVAGITYESLPEHLNYDKSGQFTGFSCPAQIEWLQI